MILNGVILHQDFNYFDLIYSKSPERCSTPCLGIATTPLMFMEKLQ